MKQFVIGAVFSSVALAAQAQTIMPYENRDPEPWGTLETVRVLDDSGNTADQSLALPEITALYRSTNYKKIAKTLPEVDILEIDQRLKEGLDLHVRPLRSKFERIKHLHYYLFSQHLLGIKYRADLTKTAMETYTSRSGNCLSHAALFVAAARYVGINAKFQSVSVPLEWQQAEDYFIVPGHINVVARIPGRKVTIEFAAAYTADEADSYSSDIISDRRALAEYYNNIGMEAFEQKNYRYALAYLAKALDTYSRLSHVWSNIGVVYKFVGETELALEHYEKALKIDKRNFSAVVNSYILLQEQGKTEQALALSRKVERHSKRNPYYLARLARSDIQLKAYKSAINLLKKAITIKPDEHKFYSDLARAYIGIGKLEKSESALRKAEQLATAPQQEMAYHQKLELISSLIDKHNQQM